jgi:hypothetical protein
MSQTQTDVFSHTPLALADAIFALTASYKADPFPQKVNLGVGAYRDNHGSPYVLPVVRKVRRSPAWHWREGGGTAAPLTCSRRQDHHVGPRAGDTQDGSSGRGNGRDGAAANDGLGTQAKQILADDDSLDHEYLPIAGLPTFTSASAKLIFGEDSPAIKEGLVSTYVASRAPCEEELEGCRC